MTVPAKVLSFFDLPWELSDQFIANLIDGSNNQSAISKEEYVPQQFAVVHSCHSVDLNDKKNWSNLIETWRLEYMQQKRTQRPLVYDVHDARRIPQAPHGYADTELRSVSKNDNKRTKSVLEKKPTIRHVSVQCLDGVVLGIEEEPGLRESFTCPTGFAGLDIDPIVLICRETHDPCRILYCESNQAGNKYVSEKNTWVDFFKQFATSE